MASVSKPIDDYSERELRNGLVHLALGFHRVKNKYPENTYSREALWETLAIVSDYFAQFEELEGNSNLNSALVILVARLRDLKFGAVDSIFVSKPGSKPPPQLEISVTKGLLIAVLEIARKIQGMKSFEQAAKFVLGRSKHFAKREGLSKNWPSPQKLVKWRENMKTQSSRDVLGTYQDLMNTFNNSSSEPEQVVDFLLASNMRHLKFPLVI